MSCCKHHRRAAGWRQYASHRPLPATPPLAQQQLLQGHSPVPSAAARGSPGALSQSQSPSWGPLPTTFSTWPKATRCEALKVTLAAAPPAARAACCCSAGCRFAVGSSPPSPLKARHCRMDAGEQWIWIARLLAERRACGACGCKPKTSNPTLCVHGCGCSRGAQPRLRLGSSSPALEHMGARSAECRSAAAAALRVQGVAEGSAGFPTSCMEFQLRVTGGWGTEAHRAGLGPAARAGPGPSGAPARCTLTQLE